MAGKGKHRDLKRLAAFLEQQGCKVRPTATGGGFIVILPGNKLLQLHGSVSDVRAWRNQRAAVKRAGLEWPDWYKV